MRAWHIDGKWHKTIDCLQRQEQPWLGAGLNLLAKGEEWFWVCDGIICIRQREWTPATRDTNWILNQVGWSWKDSDFNHDNSPLHRWLSSKTPLCADTETSTHRPEGDAPFWGGITGATMLMWEAAVMWLNCVTNHQRSLESPHWLLGPSTEGLCMIHSVATYSVKLHPRRVTWVFPCKPKSILTHWTLCFPGFPPLPRDQDSTILTKGHLNFNKQVFLQDLQMVISFYSYPLFFFLFLIHFFQYYSLCLWIAILLNIIITKTSIIQVYFTLTCPNGSSQEPELPHPQGQVETYSWPLSGY